eukprot:539503-Hanusia_phi.AAC.1
MGMKIKQNSRRKMPFQRIPFVLQPHLPFTNPRSTLAIEGRKARSKIPVVAAYCRYIVLKVCFRLPEHEREVSHPRGLLQAGMTSGKVEELGPAHKRALAPRMWRHLDEQVRL